MGEWRIEPPVAVSENIGSVSTCKESDWKAVLISAPVQRRDFDSPSGQPVTFIQNAHQPPHAIKTHVGHPKAWGKVVRISNYSSVSLLKALVVSPHAALPRPGGPAIPYLPFPFVAPSRIFA